MRITYPSEPEKTRKKKRGWMGEKIKCDSSMTMKHYNIWKSDKTRLVKDMKEEPVMQIKESEDVSLGRKEK